MAQENATGPCDLFSSVRGLGFLSRRSSRALDPEQQDPLVLGLFDGDPQLFIGETLSLGGDMLQHVQRPAGESRLRTG